MTDEEKTLRKELNALIRQKKKLNKKESIFTVIIGVFIFFVMLITINSLINISILIGLFAIALEAISTALLSYKLIFQKICNEIKKINYKKYEISHEIDKIRAKELLNSLSKSDVKKINTVLLNPDLLDTVKKVDSLLPLLSDKENAIKAIFADDEPPKTEKKQGNEAKTYVPASNK